MSVAPAAAEARRPWAAVDDLLGRIGDLLEEQKSAASAAYEQLPRLHRTVVDLHRKSPSARQAAPAASAAHTS